MTLERTLALALTLERASAETKTVTKSSTPVVDRIGHRFGNKNSQGSRHRDSSRRHQSARRRWFNCGSFDHLAKDSTSLGITCFKCHKLGHISRDCKSKKSQSKRDSRSLSSTPRNNSSDSRRDSSRGSSPGNTKSKPI